MASKAPAAKKRKMSQATPPSPHHSGRVTFKFTKTASSATKDEDPAVQTPSEIGDSLKLVGLLSFLPYFAFSVYAEIADLIAEHDNEPIPADLMDLPPRAFEIGQLVKLTLLVGSQLSTVIVKVINHAFPDPRGAWQYCLQAHCIFPAGSGVMWVDENNLQKVGLYDIGRGTAVQFTHGDQVLDGRIKDTKADVHSKDIVYEVEYTSTTTIAVKDIVKVTFSGLVPYVARPGQT
ncbi:hypothetical protein DV737_g2141, partial [Chaetothyriales sp. CBS 132003]